MQGFFVPAALALATCAAIAPPAIAQSAPAASHVASIPTANLYPHIRTRLHGNTGPLVILIPGMSTPGAVWDDSVARLSANHRLLVVEVRGFDGERGTANEAAGVIAGMVADLSADLAARNIGPATIAGHSFGGLVAMQFALDHPRQTSRLLIVDALPFFGTVIRPDASVENIAPQASRMHDGIIANADAMRAAGARGVAQGVVGQWSVGQENATRIANWAMRAEPNVVAEAMVEDMQLDLRTDIARIHVPISVLYQAEGNPEFASARYSADYAANPAVHLVPVTRTAHFIMLDRPDAFDAELAAILAR